jgi:hypothetical protein
MLTPHCNSEWLISCCLQELSDHSVKFISVMDLVTISFLFWVYHIDTINKNMEVLMYACKEVGLEINIEKTKYMLLPVTRMRGQNWDTKIANRSLEKCHSSNIWGLQ